MTLIIVNVITMMPIMIEEKIEFCLGTVSSNNKSKDESSNISIYKLAVDRNEKPTVLKGLNISVLNARQTFYYQF